MVKDEIIASLKKAIEEVTGLKVEEPQLEHPLEESHGDYSSNVAMTMSSSSKLKTQKFKTSMELAERIVEKLKVESGELKIVDQIDVVKPGFINFWLSKDYLTGQLQEILRKREDFRVGDKFEKQRMMVEYAHPNTHKEMHIGHMRTLITGEALARLFEAKGALVFRANYQGDIGPHVAKAIIGIQKLMQDRNLSLDQITKWSNKTKAHFLGEGYVVGNRLYEEEDKMKDRIDETNMLLYTGSCNFRPEEQEKTRKLYEETRRWSLDYYDEFYKRFYTKFDRLFFESEMVDCGKEIVKKNLNKVFVEDKGAIIFPGEKYDLHTRVFITKDGNPTYEGKEMCNALKQYEAFPFDKKIHVVASEQAGYFKVVFKALELIDPQKFKDRQLHISMGMVHLTNPSPALAGSGQARKMSSRTGDILTVDWLIDEVKEKVEELTTEGKLTSSDRGKVLEQIVIGAIKYSVLKVGTGQNVAFDIEKSVSLDGNSGPYLQYTYVRTQSILAKFKIQSSKCNPSTKLRIDGERSRTIKITVKSSKFDLNTEELLVLRLICRFPDVVEEVAENFAPNLLCNFLFDLAQKFNLFYQKHKVIGSDKEEFRLMLVKAVGEIIKNGLYLLGIATPERM